MGKKGNPKKRKKEDSSSSAPPLVSSEDDGGASSSSEESVSVEKDKYREFRIPDYIRSYPENGGNFEYVVFLESIDLVPIGDRDMMSLSTSIKKYNKGVKQLLRMNRYKIGVIFERPGLANAALINRKFLDSYKLKASIPAAATENTGVIMHVPIDLSNEHIYNAITSTKNIISIRRFMRRTISEGGEVSFQPTKTVSITFSCAAIPDSVDLNSWRFEVRPYIPPVKQCLKCLRYGHIAKFCKNSQRCSICTKDHNYKECQIPTTEATCCHCQGKHVAISSQCPVKQQKVEENKNKINKKSYADLFNEKSFPSLSKSSPAKQLQSLIETEPILNILIQTIVTLISQNKNNEKSICTQSIKDVLLSKIQNNINKP